MPHFRVDDALHNHPKVRKAGLEAMGLWNVAGSWCMGYLTDGFVPEWFVKAWPKGITLAKRLVAAGFWHPAEHDGEKGWQFHEFIGPGRNDSRAQIEADREKARNRKANSRASQQESRRDYQRDRPRDSRRESPRSPGYTQPNPEVPNGTPKPPDPPSDEPSPRRLPARQTGSERALDRFAGIPSAPSPLARQVAQSYSNAQAVPIEPKLLGKVAEQIDGCLRAQITPDAIAAGLDAWTRSDSFAPSQIPNYVHKAANRTPRNGVGKPTESALDYQSAAEALLAKVSTK